MEGLMIQKYKTLGLKVNKWPEIGETGRRGQGNSLGEHET